MKTLADYVMVNPAAIWEFVLSFWKVDRKWWVYISDPKGRKDFD